MRKPLCVRAVVEKKRDTIFLFNGKSYTLLLYLPGTNITCHNWRTAAQDPPTPIFFSKSVSHIRDMRSLIRARKQNAAVVSYRYLSEVLASIRNTCAVSLKMGTQRLWCLKTRVSYGNLHGISFSASKEKSTSLNTKPA